MSIRYNNASGQETILSGLTPGGDLEAGAVAQKRGSVTTPEIAAGGSYTATITFSEPMPDSDYDVIINKSRFCNAGVPYNKTINGFNLVVGNQSSSALSCNIDYVAIKTYTVQHAAQNAADIADIKAMIPSNASSTNKFSTADDLRTETRTLDRRLDDVEDVIPTSASITNQLATQNDLSNIEIDELGEINDVDLTNLADGQTLVWDDTTSKWVNGQGGKVYTAGDGIDISSADEISAKVNPAQFDFDAGGKMSLNGEYKKTFVGTKAEWDALSASKKKEYTIANITDDVIGGEVASSVSDGDERPVSSDAVYDYVSPIKTVMPSGTSSSNKLVSQNTCFIGGTKYGSTYDCDTFGPGACLVNNQTLHTPYAQGLTSDDVFMVNTFVSDTYYKCQIAVGYGTTRLYTRFRKDGGWSTWKSFIPAS